MQRLTLIFFLLATVSLSPRHAAADAVRVSVAVDGQAQLPIVVSPNAAGEVRVAAQELAETFACSESTIKRSLRSARAFLKTQMT